MEKQLLFSVTRKDFDIQFTRGSGKGGQNRNKVETAVRIVHRDSGAVGYSDTERHQLQNKKIAFERLVKSKIFQDWHKIATARAFGKNIETDEEMRRRVDDMTQDKYLKVEYFATPGDE